VTTIGRPGWLLALYRDRDGWWAYATWPNGIGLAHVGWYAAGHARSGWKLGLGLER
jgi:hypothetical protein